MKLFNFGSNKQVSSKSWTEGDNGELRQWFMSSGSSGFGEGDDYENVYSNVALLTRSAAMIEPYLKDEDGERYNGDNNVLNALYLPNADMDARLFRESAFLLYLMKPKFYVRVHYKGKRRKNGTIPAENITGLTYLEHVVEVHAPNTPVKYRCGSNTYEEHEVMTFFGLNPNNLMGGYSPMKAVRRWTRIEDFMSDMQSAHFKNGAVPAGMFIVNAATEDQFLSIKRMMQRKMRGAKNTNNVLYNWRQPDVNGGTQDQITWVPYNITNKDLALKDLHEIIQSKQDEAFGVSNVLKGNVDETTYASATTVEKYFVKYTLDPLVTAVWGRFSHELNRVTGGFGYSIGYDLPIPVLGDELTQIASAKKTDAETITLLAKSYELGSIVDAFEFPESYKKLVPLKIDAPVRDTTPELEETPAPEPNEEVEDGVETSGDKELSSKALADESRKTYEDLLIGQIGTFNDGRITEILNEWFAGEQSDEAYNRAVAAIQEILSVNNYALMESYGRSEQARAVALAGGDSTGVGVYMVSTEAREAYRKYLEKVAKSYNDVLRARIHSELEKGIAEGADATTVKSKLLALGVGEYEARRLAVSEVNRAANNASLDAYRKVQDNMPDHYFTKTWRTRGAHPCPFCTAMDGVNQPVDNTFMPVHQHVNGEDGRDYENTFVSMQTADAHPFCTCYEEYEKVAY